jgi:hypothetical protein
MPVSANLDKALDKAFENSTLEELLAQAFGIKTVADLGKNKYFATAQALLALKA